MLDCGMYMGYNDEVSRINEYFGIKCIFVLLIFII